MTWPEILLLGLIQGITEFLPVSSSGHLVAGRVLLGIADTEGLAVDTFLHLGTLLAVVVYFRREWWNLATGWKKAGEEGVRQRTLLYRLFMATWPAALVGWLAKDWADTWRDPAIVAAGLVVTGIVLWTAETAARPSENKSTMPGSTGRALFIGLAQVLALVPGISRSGMTIAAGRIMGMGKEGAVVFSFLMSAPIIAGAGGVNFSILGDGSIPAMYLWGGLLVSFLSGWVAISLLLKMVRKLSLKPFAVYVFVLAAVLFWYGG